MATVTYKTCDVCRCLINPQMKDPKAKISLFDQADCDGLCDGDIDISDICPSCYRILKVEILTLISKRRED